MIMNNKLLLIPLVSLGAIVQLPQGASAEAFFAESLTSPERSLEVSEMPNLSSVDQSVEIRSIATPEVTNDLTNSFQADVPEASNQMAVQAPDPTIASMADSTVATQPMVVVVATQPIVPTVAQVNDPAVMTTTMPVKIEVETGGIPSITDLPSRIALPPVGLLPGRFELPINMAQGVDSSISTSSPITDRLADPVLSEHLQTVQTFLMTKPEAMTIPCDSLQTEDCSPMMKPVNPTAYAAKGRSLRSEDPAANPDRPSALGPIVRERLRMTVDEVQAYRSAYSQNLVAWSNRVRQCMDEKPRMYVLRSDGAQLPVFFNGQEGTVVRNASDQAVCTN
jgi:hypothetical protein